MKPTSIITASLFALLLAGQAQAQNIQTTTLRWGSATTFKANVGEMVQEATTIVSYPDRVEWKAADGSTRSTYKILETNGSWGNVGNQGQVIFEVDSQGQRGTVQFVKDETGTRVRLSVLVNGLPEITELTIVQIETL
jgi:hypothetical protein